MENIFLPMAIYESDYQYFTWSGKDTFSIVKKKKIEELRITYR